MKRYQIITLGCRTNQYESQAFADQLKKKGYIRGKKGEKADLCIINTCTVTQSADQRSLYQIRKVSRDFSPDTLIVTGCFAKQAKQRLEDFPEVTHFIPNDKKNQTSRRSLP